MKKIFVFAALPVLLASMVVSFQAFAENGNSNSGSGGGVSGSASAGTAIISPEPIVPPTTGFVQFNNLTVQSVSSGAVPAEIVATNGVGGPTPLSTSISGSSNCFKFDSEGASSGASFRCPSTPSYRIEVTSSTQLMLRDRTQATLGSFAQGDQINVYGFYNTDGSIQAFVVRDLSKPVETQTMQLNGVTLISISASGTPATLAVTQQQGGGCFGFNGDKAQSTVCPMGVSSFSSNPSTANVAAPQALMPIWSLLRKYVVNVDSRTIILDRNRTQLPLSSLNLNDQLNVYGESSDNGQTITADIIRDISIPATPTSYSGKVTQVNADGSFVFQTSDGQTITVQNPFTVGAAVSAEGIVNQGTLSQVTRVTVGNK